MNFKVISTLLFSISSVITLHTTFKYLMRHYLAHYFLESHWNQKRTTITIG
uniref:Uncharacterized protein n=1 Tax=Solanum lycopersicum TaxID=4081 RepID=A0A3Q7I0S0_SOLLC